eukprot:m.455961 g.455961  ORF g.455961 m.455961 type:complete len:650 (+) comp56971_c0_seq1:90-2039(+)
MSHPKGLWTTEPHGEVLLKIDMAGEGARPPVTVFDVFKRTVARHGARPALAYKTDKANPWTFINYNEYFTEVKKCAKAFIRAGVEPGRTVGILGFNSPQWFISDLAAIAVGAMAAGIYTTNEPDACMFVLKHSRANACIVENKKQLDKILQVRAQLPDLKVIVQYTGKVDEALKSQNVFEWDHFLTTGSDVPDDDLARLIAAQKPTNCCTIIYTSGTTGDPKGVMMSHDNVTWTSQNVLSSVNVNEQDRLVSYLPLSHIAAQMLDLHGPLAAGACVYFAQPDALKGSLGQTLKESRPTLFLGVPRVWEKMMEKMVAVGAQTQGLKKKISTWAKATGLENGERLQKHKPTTWGYSMAGWLVYSKVRDALGLDECRYCASAAAPIGKETLEYFLSLGIPVYEVYGMSESTGPQTLSIPEKFLVGSCGPVMMGAELLIEKPDPEGNGEILFRGRHVMMGYLYNEEKTRETIDDRGWLHSGDIGRVDSNGFLYITGRIKELLITAGGENVAPVPIEDKMKECIPLLSNCMAIGDRRKFLSLLVTIKCEVDAEGGPTPKLTEQATAILQSIGSTATTVEEAIADKKVYDYIFEGIKKANGFAVSNAQKIQKFKFLPKDFSVPGGELGPTLKLKRPVVMKMYPELIESIYSGGDE